MKETTLDNLIQDPRAVVAAAKADRILITDQGRPLAVLLDIRTRIKKISTMNPRRSFGK